MKREILAEEAYLAMIDSQTKIIDALTEELKATNIVQSHVIAQHGKMRDLANAHAERILELEGIVARYRGTRRVEWLKLFLLLIAAHVAWALFATIF